LEHKIHYKYKGEVPSTLVTSLTEAAHIASDLDERMERLHDEVRGSEDDHSAWLDLDDDVLKTFRALMRDRGRGTGPAEGR
jgi:putative GTP pyrophosphokinase